MRDYIITIDEDEAELMHYGVVGMKWHHRKAGNYYDRMSSAETYAKTGWTKVGRNMNAKKAAKYRAKYQSELQKNRDNLKANKNIKNGARYTKLTKGDKFRAGLRNSTKDVAKAMAITPVTVPLAAMASTYVNGRTHRYSRKQSWDAAKQAGSMYANLYSKMAVKASEKVRDYRENRRIKTVDNNRNTGPAIADKLKAYQDAVNNASRAADNARSAAYGRGKKRRK